MLEGKRCSVCKKEWNQAKLLEGITGGEMVIVCEDCSKKEGIPTIKKPTEIQIEDTQKRKSVRERMEIMAGMRPVSSLGNEEMESQTRRQRLKAPPKKEMNPFVVETYYWNANMGRRRKKLTLRQAGEAMGLSPEVIQQIENGKIPENFEEVLPVMERFYNIKLLKRNAQSISSVKRKEEEEEILKKVQAKMESRKELSEENLDLSDKKKIENITLNDLVELREKKKKIAEAKRLREETEDLFGVDLELDDELN
jgi:ribosome-binding protein aMBF1 (putative translation factor)